MTEQIDDAVREDVRRGRVMTPEDAPFVQFKNRRCLTEQQLKDQPELRIFVSRASESFDYDDELHVWWFHD